MRGSDVGAWRLVADVGGTNVRFGAVREDPIGEARQISRIEAWPANRFDAFEDAVSAYREGAASGIEFSSAAVAGAGPVTAAGIALTNSDWVISAKGVRRAVGDAIAVRLVNDLEAVAFALPHLGERSIEWFDAVRARAPRAGRMLALNVGTGFGSAAIVAADAAWVCCPGETGHMRLGAADLDEIDLFRAIQGFGATVEDVLSGAGVQRLSRAVALKGASGNNGEAIRTDAFDFGADDAAGRQTRAIFGDLLGRVAGDLVLASAAWDGVYLTGSVALAYAQSADRARFRQAFVGTSKMQERLAGTPVALIRDPVPALIGLAHLTVT